jgi:hypothetical protein
VRLFGKVILSILQIGFVFSLFKYGITGKQAGDRPLSWFYRVLSLALGSFIVVGGVFVAVSEHEALMVLIFQMCWTFIKDLWTKVL